MRYLKGFYMSLGMFCAIPLPRHVWDESCAGLMLPCYPLVGAVIGAAWWGITRLLSYFEVSLMLMAAISAVCPFILTGFLHLDGYMDTFDALLSRRPLEDKLRILKDSTVGAFSVIALVILFLLQFAAAHTFLGRGITLAPLAFIPTLSRACTAVSILSIRAIPQSGYASMMKEHTGILNKLFPAIIGIISAALLILTGGAHGIAAAAGVILGSGIAMGCAYSVFRGISGDLAGFSLVIGELCAAIALAVI